MSAKPDYARGTIEMWNADAMDVLPEMQTASVDCVLTDPPYLIGAKSDLAGKTSYWPDVCNASSFFSRVYRDCKRLLTDTGCMWTYLNWRTLPSLQKAACDAQWWIESLLVWDKLGIGPGMRGLRPRYELVALLIKPAFTIQDRSIPDVCQFPWMTRKRHHPAEKPLAMVQWLLEISHASSVLDPFAGSGTTAIAAAQLGCSFRGCELDHGVFDRACKRIDDAIDGALL